MKSFPFFGRAGAPSCDVVAEQAKSLRLPEERGNRRGFLRKAAVAGAAVPAAMIASSSEARASHQQNPQDQRIFTDILIHENQHVVRLQTILGSSARPKPNFVNLELASYESFVAVSQALENTGVGAYLGAAGFINDTGVLATAAQIALIEGRHAGWLNTRLNDPIAMNALGADLSFEQPLSQEEVFMLAGPFINDLNGGPPIAYSTTEISPQNDIAIMNFALALEFLEAEFYNINVPKFLYQL